MAKIIAKTRIGQEYIYSKKKQYAVADAKAAAVCETLNRIGWNLKDGEAWRVYEIGEWELKYIAAGYQRFIAGKNGIRVRYE